MGKFTDIQNNDVLFIFYYCRWDLAPQLPSHHSHGVTNMQNISTKSLKFLRAETEEESILARMNVFKRWRIYWKWLSVQLIVKVSVYWKQLWGLIACCIVPSHWLECNRREHNLCCSLNEAFRIENTLSAAADHPCLFSVGVSTSCNGNRQSTHTSNTTHKQSKQTKQSKL